jgi:hypothetical protein
MHLPLSQLVVRTMCFVCLPSECCHMRFPGYVIKLAVSNLNQRGWVPFWHLPTVDLKINKSVLIDRFSAVVLLVAAFVLPCSVIFQCVVLTYSDFRLPKVPLVMYQSTNSSPALNKMPFSRTRTCRGSRRGALSLPFQNDCLFRFQATAGPAVF